MSIDAIDSVIQQMRTSAASSGLRAPELGVQGEGHGFAAELRKSLTKVNNLQQAAYRQAEAFELGKPGVALNDVMVDLQKANVAFQTGLQVRNRLVTAYQEIMSLQA